MEIKLKFRYFLLIPVIALFMACGDDDNGTKPDDNGNDSTETSTAAADYNPLTINNKWNYDVEAYVIDEYDEKSVLGTFETKVEITEKETLKNKEGYKFDETKLDNDSLLNPRYNCNEDSKIYNYFTPSITDFSTSAAQYFPDFDFGIEMWIEMADFKMKSGDNKTVFDTNFTTKTTLPQLIAILGTDTVGINIDIKITVTRRNDTTIAVAGADTACAVFDYDIHLVVKTDDTKINPAFNKLVMFDATVAQESWYAMKIGRVQYLEEQKYTVYGQSQEPMPMCTFRKLKSYQVQ